MKKSETPWDEDEGAPPGQYVGTPVTAAEITCTADGDTVERLFAAAATPPPIPLSEDLRLAQSAVLALVARLADLGAAAVNLPNGLAAAIEYLSRSARFLGNAAEDAAFQDDVAHLDIPEPTA